VVANIRGVSGKNSFLKERGTGFLKPNMEHNFFHAMIIACLLSTDSNPDHMTWPNSTYRLSAQLQGPKSVLFVIILLIRRSNSGNEIGDMNKLEEKLGTFR